MRKGYFSRFFQIFLAQGKRSQPLVFKQQELATVNFGFTTPGLAATFSPCTDHDLLPSTGNSSHTQSFEEIYGIPENFLEIE
ncbi:hypothetical protein KC355_g16996, partial [Hortaea werneckii]